jgi:hypothetical protein
MAVAENALEGKATAELFGEVRMQNMAFQEEIDQRVRIVRRRLEGDDDLAVVLGGSHLARLAAAMIADDISAT